MSGQTPWQTVGPFFHYALPWKGGADLVEGKGDAGARMDLLPDGHYTLNPNDQPRGAAKGAVVTITGTLFDGDGVPIPDGFVELWQANAAGRYDSPDDTRAEVALDPDFIGFGRAATDADGIFTIRTVKPGRVPGPGNSLQAPHIAISVMARGIIKRMVSRIYFADEPSNAEDPILDLVPPARRATLLAVPAGEGHYRFDIRLQGDGETVFFDI
ncbi:protocatechuate 3,4-dioxygenase subunit alpha [Niveispirillum fermenti]|uniref:protocatechuate 3,4-dioxygenase subunit alpha n=1 Tax=Niveispirillum fermenti TaxID=1233113 RepID=UPI003A8B8660